MRSNRRNVQYIKSSLLYEDEILGVPVHGLIVAKIFNGKLNLKKLIKRDKEDIQIYLSKQLVLRGIKSMINLPVNQEEQVKRKTCA